MRNTTYSKSKIPSLLASQETSLSEPMVIQANINEINRTFEFEFKQPLGGFDYFTIDLINLNQNISDAKILSINSTLYLNLTNQIVLPGNSYEIWSATVKKDRIKRTKLVESFLVRPEPIDSIQIYTVTASSINVTWQEPSIGLFKPFLINLISLQSQINSLMSNRNWVILNDLNSLDTYSIEISSCSSRPGSFECQLQSETKSTTFSFNQQKFKNLEYKIIDTNVQLKWHSDLHDISKYLLRFENMKTKLINKCFLVFSDREANSCEWSLKCLSSECFVLIDNLSFNTKYNLTLIPLSLSQVELSPINLEFKTETSLPDQEYDTLINYNLQAKLESSYLISLNYPQIDQSNGNILETNLFLIKLGKLQDFNVTGLYHLEQTRDQIYLKNIFKSNNVCSNQTGLLEPCLLQTLTKPFSKQIVFVGKFSENIERIVNISAENETLIEYENITTNIIEPSSLYQLFYVFKIGDPENDSKNVLYFATRPSEPIQTKPLNYNLLLSNGLSRDGLALWIIIVICVVASIFLIGVIITLVILTLIKYKPSKFHKAAQLVAGSHANNILNNGCQQLSHFSNNMNLRSKFDRHEDYLGLYFYFITKHLNCKVCLSFFTSRKYFDYQKLSCYEGDYFFLK